ncbi:MAG: leucyl aminopeptidase, partial [Alphaproteobacteria bacterium HGW-Alphaproteobacteria-2]
MTAPLVPDFVATDLAALARAEGRIALPIAPEGRLDAGARRLDRLARGALARLAASPAFAKLKPGEASVLHFPAGLAAEALIVVK